MLKISVEKEKTLGRGLRGRGLWEVAAYADQKSAILKSFVKMSTTLSCLRSKKLSIVLLLHEK